MLYSKSLLFIYLIPSTIIYILKNSKGEIVSIYLPRFLPFLLFLSDVPSFFLVSFSFYLNIWNFVISFRASLLAMNSFNFLLFKTVFISPLLFKKIFLATRHVGSSLPNQGSNPCPLHWKCIVLATGPSRKSLHHYSCRTVLLAVEFWVVSLFLSTLKMLVHLFLASVVSDDKSASFESLFCCVQYTIFLWLFLGLCLSQF